MASKRTKYTKRKERRLSNPPDSLIKESTDGRNLEEEKMISFLMEKDLFDACSPALREAIRANHPKRILKESESLAALRLLNLANYATSESVQFQSAKEILYMMGHKPTERHAVGVIDFNALSDEELDAKIKSRARELYGADFIDGETINDQGPEDPTTGGPGNQKQTRADKST